MFRHATIALACLAMPAHGWAQGAGQAGEAPLTPAQAEAQQRALRDAIPLTPAMIRELAHRLGETERAREESVAQIASPVSRALKVTYQPGQATPIVQTVRGYPTQLAFFDATGQPFPIVWDTNSNSAGGGGGGGSTGNCNTQPGGGGGPAVEAVGFHVCVPVKGSNVLQLTPLSLAPRGGLLVSLQGAPKALTFLVIAGGVRYDADVSVLVDRRGPNARVQVDTRPGAPITGAAYLTAMLSGIAPADAVPLQVGGIPPDDVRAWRMGGEMYLRTRLTLMSPPWSAREDGEGDVRIYALPSTPSVLFDIGGHPVSASLKE